MGRLHSVFAVSPGESLLAPASVAWLVLPSLPVLDLLRSSKDSTASRLYPFKDSTSSRPLPLLPHYSLSSTFGMETLLTSNCAASFTSSGRDAFGLVEYSFLNDLQELRCPSKITLLFINPIVPLLLWGRHPMRSLGLPLAVQAGILAPLRIDGY